MHRHLVDQKFPIIYNIFVMLPAPALILTAAVVLGGCASTPQPVATLPYDSMKNFTASCPHAREQLAFVNRRLEEYQEYHKLRPYTIEDRRYYGHLKNAQWSLRSTCKPEQL